MSTKFRQAHRGRRLVGASAMCLAALIGALALPVVAGGAPFQAIRRAPVGLPGNARALTVEGGHPSISGDGRWIVFEGRAPDGTRSTVYRTDRSSGETVELSHLPADVRPGDTITPVISSDGCVVVVQTQLALDLFRDDNNDERWDVYRLHLPECGGQFDVWELVSASPRTGTARDDVVVEYPPTLSGSGAVVAFTHPAEGTPDGVTTITVVDLTVPVGDPRRSQPVAGVPIEAPNSIYRYRGAAQPALSANGRQLAFRSDTSASDPLPGWGTGPVPGGFATSQVYVWDRGDPDRFTAVELVSGRNGVPSAAGAEDPAISEDGRIVVFTSIDRSLVDATFPVCVGECPSQIYRFDRDTDANGVFDEPPRGVPLTLVSAIDAGVGSRPRRPVAGNLASWSPSVNTDGSQVVFVTDASNLLPTKAGGGGATTDGDIVVAEVLLGQLRRATGNPATGTIPGAHDNPVLSDTGRVVAFDSVIAGRVTGDPALTGRHVVTITSQPAVSMAAADFGTVLVGWESEEIYVSVLNDGPGAFRPAGVTSTSPNFRVTGGTCRRGVVVPAGGSCTVYLTFNATEPVVFAGALTVSELGDDPISVTSSVRGVGGEPTLQANPPGLDLHSSVVNGTGDRRTLDIRNVSFLPTSIASIRLGGNNPDDFVVVGQSCTNRALNPDASCSVEVEFRPRAAGRRSALVLLQTPTGEYTSAIVSGEASYAPQIGVASPSVQVGGVLGIGGSGFPANSGIVLRFADGIRPFAIATTNESGVFLIEVEIPVTEGAGERVLIASSPDQVAASTNVLVIRPPSAVPGVPGFGLG
ncbi:MAG TPA: choice-of-anchor D domain-containing protein [Ilumatobacteraceae bacterium]|nr:choice-of-anchor D domain-containing protein [Ilumatobacteraceae bacterium]